MAKQTIVWTVLPHARADDGRLRVSIVASPRLTPEDGAEQVLQAFPEWVDWPATLSHVKFALQIGAQTIDLERVGTADSTLWMRLFDDHTPVAGFVFKDMSKVNLRSFAVRNVLGTLRTHYGALAVQTASTHPMLLPWKNAHPSLKGMLTELGTRTHTINLGREQIEQPLPGFDRFFGSDDEEPVIERTLRQVFGPGSKHRAPAAGIGADGAGNPVPGGDFALRVLPADWQDPALGGPYKAQMKEFASAAEYDLYQADRFYRRETPSAKQRAMRRPNFADIPPSPKPPEFDFHRIVASYADYPQLLRKLGLIIDCVLPADSPIEQQIAVAPLAQGVMGLVLKWDDPAHDPAVDSCPRTAWQADADRFTTRPRSGDHQRGLLRLRGAHDRWNKAKGNDFDVYQVDPDGAALKTVDFVLSAQNLVAKSLKLGTDSAVTYTTGDKQPVAALRAGGLGVSRHGRAKIIAQSAASAALKDKAIRAGAAASKNIVLFTEDVLRGYRVDVQPLPPGVAALPWESLCRRRGVYRFVIGTETLALPEDEGYVKGASTTSTANKTANPDDHFLHESLFRWAGWSLVTPRPGRTLRASTDSASGVQGEAPEDVTDAAAAGGNGLAVTFSTAKGSLPKLRFGMPYRFRARITDLAGNSLAHDDTSLEADPNATDPVTYWRFEPVDPPALVQRVRLSEGESLERMVIRSNWNASTTAYLTTSAFAAAIALPASADFDYTAVNERHVVPPKAAQLQCEQHGLFDALLSSPADIKAAYATAAREAGTLYDDGPGTLITLVTPQSLTNVATTHAVPPQLPSSDNPTGDRLAPGQYVIHGEAQVATPYLPDGAAGGFALRAAPGHALPGVVGPMVLGPSAAVLLAPNQELVLVVAHGNEWPDTVGFRIVLAERVAALTDPPCNENFADDGAPLWDEASRVLTLFIAKGRIVRLFYASFVDKTFIDTFGLPDWVDSAGEREFVRGMAQLGCGWMITPYRSLVLVHATQQPVCAPELLALDAKRDLGDPHATLQSRIRLHGPSTGKFEVEAAWDEWIDDIDQPEPKLTSSQGQLGEVQLAENHPNLFSFEPAVKAQQSAGIGQTRAPGDRHEFGDTKFRLIRYQLRATTRFREYVPPALYAKRDQVTRLGPIAEGPAMQMGADNDPGAPVLRLPTGSGLNTIVPASAPPDEPRPLYIVPTFRWNEASITNGLDSTRLGNGLRVWLERPWFSSGNGELLGIVIFGESRPFTQIPNALVPLVTQWGLDPIWDTALPKPQTRVSDFAARVADETVSLRELPDVKVHVIGHRVHWDKTRQLWYCDIELDAGRSYMPFVRLALVRYQPNAVEAAKISKVVLAEFAQVLPRRRVTFTRNGATLNVKLHGRVPEHGPMKFPVDSEYEGISFVPFPGQPTESGRNKFELVLQTRDPTIDSDLAWSDVSVLASSTVAPSGGGLLGTGDAILAQPNPLENAVATVQDRLGRRIALSAMEDLGGITASVSNSLPVGIGVVPSALIDPAVWQTTTTLPDTRGKPARVAVREYERYYTDRTVPEFRASATRRRRVVEERLVYTAFFDL